MPPRHDVLGSVLGRTLPQVPFVPPVFDAAHATQVLAHVALQQKPSAQWALEHSWLPVASRLSGPHAEPCDRFGEQVPPALLVQ
jgi:hypothetical protein